MAYTQPRRTRILVIDDEQKICRILTEFFRDRGYAVATASSMSEAVQQLERFSPHVILLDLAMPGISGFGLLKLIRSQVFPPRVIMITANDSEEAVQQAMREGAEAYMCKPLRLDALERVVSGFWPPDAERSDPPAS